ncbi:MAG: ATP-binding protein [Polyangiaceae bacterium]
MVKAARFKVDPKLASLLGESYRSSEEALKELVDNAWDADAENVNITLPGAVDGGPIVIEDDGSGMTETELREEYLKIANDRCTRKGETTPTKRRKVKGRKGIGKFVTALRKPSCEAGRRLLAAALS